MVWTRGPTIGRGSTAAVSVATTPAGDYFAVKSTDLSSSTLLQREEYLISQLCSPYVVKCLGSDVTCEGDKVVYNLFMEYVPGGTLSDQIRKQGTSLEESAIRFYASQVLQGLDYLHRKGLVHGDIKGQNILVGDGGVKIGDFGCAKWAEGGGSVTSAFSGTPAYMAPEVARGEEQSFPADIWAFGCTIIEMATGCHPWPEMKDPASALYRIAFSGDVPEFPSWFSEEANDLLGQCLRRDPKERWTAAELLQHPFFSSVEEKCEEIKGLTRRSPTSVTDQGFWDAFEASDSSRNPTEIGISSDSPAERIRALIGAAFRQSLGFTEDEDWLTVRASEIEEVCYHDVEIDDFLVAESIIEDEDEDEDQDEYEEEEEVPTSTSMEDSLLDYCNGDDGTFPIVHSESVKDFLYSELLISKIILLELFLHQDQINSTFSNVAFIFYHHSLVDLFLFFSYSRPT